MALIVLVPLAAGILALYLFQDRLIYFPRRYRAAEVAGAKKSLQEIRFTTDQGRQTAFYEPPREGDRPDRLWIAFGGNGSVALNWIELAMDRRRNPRDSFLLIDYPGYGLCEGVPGPAQIRENGTRAFEEVARQFGEEPDSLARQTGVIGHSLGCAAALMFAQDHPVERVILLAPFTSLLDMAARRVGWPLKYLLRGNYDNRVILDALDRRDPRPVVTILHGTDDRIIPFAMGRALAEAHPEMIRFIPVEGARHNDLPDLAEERIMELMDSPRDQQSSRL